MARVELSVPRSIGPDTSRPILLSVSARTIAEALSALARLEPAVGALLLAADGSPRRSVAIYLGGTDVRELDDGPATRLHDGDAIEVVPALPGG